MTNRFLATPCARSNAVDRHCQHTQPRPLAREEPRPVVAGAQLHPSHRACYWRGWWWCWVCGCRGSERFAALAKPCV
eukprot:12428316-Alexandrium_andersonii.AAC.1